MKLKKPKAVKKPSDAKIIKRLVKEIREDNALKYVATAIVMGKKYRAEGATPSEAIGGLQIRNCKGKCILAVSCGLVKRERVMMPQIVSRLFNSAGITREISLKQISSRFF